MEQGIRGNTMETKHNIHNPSTRDSSSMVVSTRDAFREGVFNRDNYKCVICHAPAKDAHHIIERRLFDNGGYFLDNGASLCEDCHIKAEQTTLSCSEIRAAAKITQVVLPEHLYVDEEIEYDKWGNIILPNGTRLRGELFNDESVQKILKAGGVLESFTNFVKYPRTYHLPWSEKLSKDDRKMESTDSFQGKRVVVTIKEDGENTTMYNNHIHARSLDSRNHPSRNWVKNLWSRIAADIPEGWRICGENLYGMHTIKYRNLDTYFHIISIWNEKNECLSWEDTKTYAALLDIPTVPVIFEGMFNESTIKKIAPKTHNGDPVEGYIVRLADKFNFVDFRKSIGKVVYNNFVIKHGHWTSRFETNELRA